MSRAAASLSTADTSTLVGMFDNTVRLIRAGDWAGWAAQYAEDAVFHPPNGPAVTGQANIRKWGDEFPPVEALAFSNVQVFGAGDFAYGMSAYTLTIKGLPPDTGKQLAVLRRGTDGWQVVAVSFNSDLPLPVQT